MIGSLSSQSAVDDRCLQDDLAVVGDDWNAVITVIVDQVGNAAEFVVLGSHLKQIQLNYIYEYVNILLVIHLFGWQNNPSNHIELSKRRKAKVIEMTLSSLWSNMLIHN